MPGLVCCGTYLPSCHTAVAVCAPTYQKRRATGRNRRICDAYGTTLPTLPSGILSAFYPPALPLPRSGLSRACGTCCCAVAPPPPPPVLSHAVRYYATRRHGAELLTVTCLPSPPGRDRTRLAKPTTTDGHTDACCWLNGDALPAVEDVDSTSRLATPTPLRRATQLRQRGAAYRTPPPLLPSLQYAPHPVAAVADDIPFNPLSCRSSDDGLFYLPGGCVAADSAPSVDLRLLSPGTTPHHALPLFSSVPCWMWQR